MTIGLSNSGSRARNYGSTVNQNQGGGSKKAGFPYIVGRTSWVSIYFNNTNVANKSCCTLPNYNAGFSLTNISRNIGRNGNPSYWKMPGV